MKSQLKSLIILTILTFSVNAANAKTISANSSSDSSLKKYYFPIEILSKPKVYHYKPEGEHIDHLYWILTIEENQGKTFLKTESYNMDSTGRIKNVETIMEELGEEGAAVIQYVEVQKDKNDNQFDVNAEIDSNWVFKWNLNTNDSLIWDFKTESKIYTGYNVRTQKIRKFKGPTNKVLFNGQHLNAIMFLDSFSISFTNMTLNDQQDLNFTQTSWYVDGIGMYQYVRELPNQLITYTLTEILTIDQWNQQIKKE